MMRQAPQTGKFKRLLRKLRPHVEHPAIDPETIVVGILEKLWHTTAAQAPQGDIGRIDDELICEAVGWHGDPGTLIDSLVTSQWLDRDSVHRLLIHDWEDHCPNSVKQNLRRWQKDFAYPNSHLDDPKDDPKEPPKETPKGVYTEPDRTEPNQTKPKGRLTSDEGDQIEISVEDDQVRNDANKVSEKLGRAKNANDRSLVLKACWLARYRFSENWLWDSVEAVRKAKPRPSKPYGYFHTCLDNHCREKLKRNFTRELARIIVPDELLSMPPPVSLSERLCSATSPESNE
jgi:hypothetical protein